MQSWSVNMLAVQTRVTKNLAAQEEKLGGDFNVKDNDEESGQERIRFIVKTGEPTSKTVESRQRGFFPLKSSVTALWSPAVVGDQEFLFITTVISNLVTKIGLLITLVTLALLGYQQSVFLHPIILWCEDEWKPESLAGNITLCSFDTNTTNLTSCSDSS